MASPWEIWEALWVLTPPWRTWCAGVLVRTPGPRSLAAYNRALDPKSAQLDYEQVLELCHNAALTERDNVRFARLIADSVYQRCWPHDKLSSRRAPR